MNKQSVKLTEFVNPDELLEIVTQIIENNKITSMVRTTSMSGRDKVGRYLIIYEAL